MFEIVGPALDAAGAAAGGFDTTGPAFARQVTDAYEVEAGRFNLIADHYFAVLVHEAQQGVGSGTDNERKDRFSSQMLFAPVMRDIEGACPLWTMILHADATGKPFVLWETLDHDSKCKVAAGCCNRLSTTRKRTQKGVAQYATYVALPLFFISNACVNGALR